MMNTFRNFLNASFGLIKTGIPMFEKGFRLLSTRSNSLLKSVDSSKHQYKHLILMGDSSSYILNRFCLAKPTVNTSYAGNFILNSKFHTLSPSSQGLIKNSGILGLPQQPSLTGFVSVRTKIREHFVQPNEMKRIKRHGWKKRMSTKAGREIIMRRILKGRHCITH